MKTGNFITSSCRYCRYYQTEGRRGGMCQQLSVPVQSHWKACVLAEHPFTSTWESLEEVMRLEQNLAIEPTIQCSSVATSHTEMPLKDKQLTPV